MWGYQQKDAFLSHMGFWVKGKSSIAGFRGSWQMVANPSKLTQVH